MRAVVVGAGISGLMAARALRNAGNEVIVLDKGRGPGGRLATRRIDGATVDHGAQFFTVRSDTFQQYCDDWLRDDLVVEWCRGFAGQTDGYPRYAVRGGMNALAKHLARGLDVRTSTLVFGVRRGPGTTDWLVDLDDGAHIPADLVVVTCPLPQTFTLLLGADVQMPEDLWRTDYDRTLALLAVLDRPSAVDDPGGLQGEPGFTFIADNARKAISAVPALTAHADPAWSETHWDSEPSVVMAALSAMVGPYLGEAMIVDAQVKRWRFATPRTIWPDPCWVAEPGTLVCAGDAFAGPRVEGAALSGLAAAAALGAR
jgi:renalase